MGWGKTSVASTSEDGFMKAAAATSRIIMRTKSPCTPRTTLYCMMGKTGVLEYLKKGQKVQVIGNFRFSMTNKDGRSFPNLQVNALSVELVGKKAE